MKKITAVLLAATVLVACNPSEESMKKGSWKLVEKVDKKEGEIVIAYEKYEYPNGLTLLIHEDHSDPIVHVDVTYHVGSAREEIGLSGFAHFFEHMMFQGSDNIGDEQHFKIVSEAGGTLNGSTNTDRTNYFETLPSNYLERALWMEADRMGFLLDAVTQEKFEIQRATVKNERGQRYDNAPYGLVNEKVGEHLYPYGHPYSWSTIGYLKDLDSANVEDLKRFFLRWYGPNNATLTVGGDVDKDEVLASVEKYFGPIPRGPEVQPMEKQAAIVESDRYVSYEDQYIRFPLLQMVFPTVPGFHEDEAPLDVLSDILGGGKHSIFYKNFVKTRKAINANAYHPAQELAGKMEISIVPMPGTTLSEAEQMVRTSIEEFEQRGVNEDDLQRTKSQIESQMIYGLETVAGKVRQLAQYQTVKKDANYIQKDLERYMSVTKEDVMRVFEKYIKNKPALVMSVYPSGQQNIIAKEDNYTQPTSGEVSRHIDYEGLAYNKPVDTFDRSVMPAAGANPVIQVPDYWEINLKNEIAVIGAENNEVPTVSISYSIPGGSLLDGDKNGLASLTATLMNESTEKYTTEDLSNELNKLGSTVYISSSRDEINVYISSLVKNLDKTLDIAKEKLFHPKFTEEDFARIKQQQLKVIENSSTNPANVASRVYSKALYGEGHPFSLPSYGTISSVSSINLEDVQSYYENNLSPKNSKLVIVGDIKKDEILGKLDFLEAWEAKEVAIPEVEVKPLEAGKKIYLVDIPGSAQSQIRMGRLALPYDATGEFYKATIMNYVLGGAFNSRVNLNLREEKGYTYGANTRFSGSKWIGPYTASAGVKIDKTDASIVEFLKEIDTYSEKGITEEELNFTKNSIGQSKARKYETSRQKASFLSRILEYNLPKNFVSHQEKILKEMSEEEIQRLAKKYLNTDDMIIVVAGDKAVIKPGLENLGWGEIIEVDDWGNAKTAYQEENMQKDVSIK